MSDEQARVYVASSAGEDGGGLYVYEMGADGALNPVSRAPGARRTTFGAFSPDGRFLYVANAVEEFGGRRGGSVCAFAVDCVTGRLEFLNERSSRGGTPCHLAVDGTGRCVMVANFRGEGDVGSVAVLPVGPDGRLGEATDRRQHEGSRVHPERQLCSHCHSVTVGPGHRRVYVADLGTDRVMIYRLDAAAGKLAPNETPYVSVETGSGPRHFDFHPDAPYAYLINEIANTVIAFAWDEGTGGLEEIQTVSTLPDDFEEGSACADIHVAPSGRYLYGSNRGHDSIAIFGIDPGTGKLDPKGHQPSGGEAPRAFAITPGGRTLIVANRASGNLASFRADPEDGGLAPLGAPVRIPSPVWVGFLGPR